jgi:hypothetical protein
MDYYYMKYRLDSVAIETCRNSNILCIDAAETRFWNNSDFYDYEHMTPAGTKKLGNYLYTELKGYLQP